MPFFLLCRSKWAGNWYFTVLLYLLAQSLVAVCKQLNISTPTDARQRNLYCHFPLIWEQCFPLPLVFERHEAKICLQQKLVSGPFANTFIYFVFSLFWIQPTARRVLCCVLCSSRNRPADSGSKPSYWSPGSLQHSTVHVLLHTAEKNQHCQYVGRSCRGCHSPHHGLDSSNRQPGCRWVERGNSIAEEDQMRCVTFWDSCVNELLKNPWQVEILYILVISTFWYYSSYQGSIPFECIEHLWPPPPIDLWYPGVDCCPVCLSEPVNLSDSWIYFPFSSCA